MRLRLSIGVAIVAMLPPAFAHAHTPGLSTADFAVQPSGEVEALLTFSLATAEPLTGTVLDRNGDGIVTQEDLSAARNDLRAFVSEGVQVDADGSPCDGALQGAALTETDGLELQASYSCPRDPAEIQVTLYYLSMQTSGPSRRGIARIASSVGTVEGVLTGDRRAISLHLPRAEKAHERIRTPPLRLAFVTLATVVVGWLAWSSRRWRAARTTWQNRAP
jgi:hypothetical protein